MSVVDAQKKGRIMNAHYTLYGAKISLYTGKLRSYLSYKQIPFTEVRSTLRVYKKVIIPKTGVRFIPVLKTPEGEYLQDTSAIIDVLETRFTDTAVLPASPVQRLVSQLFELYADEWLLLPAMHYRWNKDNDDYIFPEFGSVVLPRWPNFMRHFVGKKISTKFRGFVPLLGINDDTIPAIEDQYENYLLKALDAHFSQHNYLLGDAASIGDFGLMGPLYAHLFLDPYPGKLMQKTAPNVVKWIERMNSAPKTIGAFLPDDTIADTLFPILHIIFAEQWPVLASTLSHFEQWVSDNPNTPIPRMLGKHTFKIGKSESERAISSFSVWKLQRVLDSFNALSQSQQSEVKVFLANFKGDHFMDLPIKNRVKRENNKLVLE